MMYIKNGVCVTPKRWHLTMNSLLWYAHEAFTFYALGFCLILFAASIREMMEMPVFCVVSVTRVLALVLINIVYLLLSFKCHQKLLYSHQRAKDVYLLVIHFFSLEMRNPFAEIDTHWKWWQAFCVNVWAHAAYVCVCVCISFSSRRNTMPQKWVFIQYSTLSRNDDNTHTNLRFFVKSKTFHCCLFGYFFLSHRSLQIHFFCLTEHNKCLTQFILFLSLPLPLFAHIRAPFARFLVLSEHWNISFCRANNRGVTCWQRMILSYQNREHFVSICLVVRSVSFDF